MAEFLGDILDYGSQCIAVTFFARTEKQIGIPRLVCPPLYNKAAKNLLQSVSKIHR